MKLLNKANDLVAAFEATINSPQNVSPKTKLYTGVDLGTAYIVLAVVDEAGNPIAGKMQFAQVVKDGLVVDYLGAVKIVKRLKAEIEIKLGRELEIAGVAYPPGTLDGDRQAIKHVAEAAGFEVDIMVDEPTAANHVLEISEGAVVDIGGGTTGIAILKDGKVVYVADEPTGGTHFSLVIAGSYGLSFEEAEKLKNDVGKHKELLPVVKPVMQKVGSIVGRYITKFPINDVYLVGGTACFTGIEEVIAREVGKPTWKPGNPFLVTPLGIALAVQVTKDRLGC